MCYTRKYASSSSSSSTVGLAPRQTITFHYSQMEGGRTVNPSHKRRTFFDYNNTENKSNIAAYNTPSKLKNS